jgi:hypothetical protein
LLDDSLDWLVANGFLEPARDALGFVQSREGQVVWVTTAKTREMYGGSPPCPDGEAGQADVARARRR